MPKPVIDDKDIFSLASEPAEKRHKLKVLVTRQGQSWIDRAIVLAHAMAGDMIEATPEADGDRLVEIVRAWIERQCKP